MVGFAKKVWSVAPLNFKNSGRQSRGGQSGWGSAEARLHSRTARRRSIQRASVGLASFVRSSRKQSIPSFFGGGYPEDPPAGGAPDLGNARVTFNEKARVPPPCRTRRGTPPRRTSSL